MGVELHGVSHDVGHLVVASVVHALHRVQYSPLHGLQSVLDMRHGALEDDVRRIIEKPVLVHPAEVMHGRSVKPVDRLEHVAFGHRPVVYVVEYVLVLFLYAFAFLYFVVHV